MRATKTRLMLKLPIVISKQKSTHKTNPSPLKQKKNPIELSYSIKKNMKTNHTIIRDCDVNS